MKVKLTQDHSIRGQVEKADSVVDISEGVALDLIKRGIARNSQSQRQANNLIVKMTFGFGLARLLKRARLFLSE